ncbi:ATP-binding protein [Janthinobacterium sp. 17J80-10]|uniref:ATP-binding protein n=1 Tax=Janthinobacterium sp. 17J80-10 TaxID=2497863 RepID=UPI00100537A1|nr:ATP-binding protein [Janthinobacterium sp. 17J80-10]QAU33352.1 two-component sensor histidine kinase [Janthinobacterium sp. 17J80-10]
MMRSLRIRLILLLGVAIVAASAVQFTTSFRTAMSQADKLFDYHMQQMALALQDSPFQQEQWYSSPHDNDNAFEFVIQIWTEDGVRVYQSRRYSSLPNQGVLGYSNVTLDNGDWRVFGVRNETRMIQVAQKLEARRSRAISLAMKALWPSIPVLLLLLGVVWWVVTSALAPLDRIGRDLANRNADSLAPVDATGVPQEVSRLVAEVNSLMGRMVQALQAQKRFVDDAAHELRSLLTALTLQVKTLSRARDDAARAQAITRLQGGVDRASHLMEQLLVLARQDPLSESAPGALVSIADCVEQAADEMTPLALSRQIELHYGTLPNTRVRGDVESLRMLVRNLLDNAIRYTPVSGQVRVKLAVDDAHAVLAIEDSGSGIPAENRDRIFDRFYRVPGTNVSGSGLGLAIVKAIADRYHASVELGQAALGGLAIQVRFPLPEGIDQPKN